MPLLAGKNPYDRSISVPVILAACLAAVPVLIPAYPPMADLPQHVAAVMVLDLVHFGDYAYGHMFEFNWDRPYWLAYFLVWLFSQVVDYVLAAKLVVALAIVALVLSLIYMRREFNAPASLDWLFLAVPFGFAYDWGFLSFLIALPLCPLFVVCYRRFLENRTGWKMVLAWIFLLYFAHLLALAFCCLVGASMALRGEPSLKRVVGRVLPLLASIPLGVGWFLANIETRNIDKQTVWGIGWDRLYGFLPEFFYLEAGIVNLLLAAFVLGLPFLLGARPKWSTATIVPPLFFFLFMMFTPSLLADNLGTNERFQVLGVMFLVLMLEDAEIVPPKLSPQLLSLLTLLPVLVGAGMLARKAQQAYAFHLETSEFRHMLNLMEPGKRALGLMDRTGSAFSRKPVYMHMPVWYQVEKQGLVDFNFAEWPSLAVYYREQFRNPHLPMFPRELDWDLNRLDNYDYIVVRGTNEFLVQTPGRYAERLNMIYPGYYWFLLAPKPGEDIP